MKLSFIFSFFFLCIVGLAHADPLLQEKVIQTDMNICAASGFKKADEELNRVYSKEEVYKDDKEFLTALKNSQLAWIKFRDAEYEDRILTKINNFTVLCMVFVHLHLVRRLHLNVSQI